MAQPDVWSETAFVSIVRDANQVSSEPTEHDFLTTVETIDIDEGNKPIEQIPNIKGGNLVRNNPQEMTTVTLELYPVEILPGQAGISKLFQDPDADETLASEQGVEVQSSLTRGKFRCTILWTEATSSSGLTANTNYSNGGLASGEVAAGNAALRWAAADARIVQADKDFTDGVLQFTVNMEAPTIDKAGNSTHLEQSSDDTDDGSTDPALTHLAKYDGSTKF